MYRSAYLKNGFDKLFGYQYHLYAILAERLKTQALLVFILSLLPIWRLSFLGLTRRRERKIYHWVSVGKSIGGEETEWHKALGNGMEFNWLLLWEEGCKFCKVFNVGG
ncbi:MAG: hypothetical protein JZU53_01295 [Paludibacter sp.]|nr:hypothetical protein [Paludibacter sp.]